MKRGIKLWWISGYPPVFTHTMKFLRLPVNWSGLDAETQRNQVQRKILKTANNKHLTINILNTNNKTIKNTIRDGGNAALFITETVDTVYTAYPVTWFTLFTLFKLLYTA